MKTQTITFPDGYKVTITEERVTVTLNGKSQWDKSLYFRPLPESEAAICAAIRKQGNDPANYLWNGSTMKPMVVRAGEGVAEAIAEATAAERATQAAQAAERNAKWEAEKAADRALIEAAKAKAAAIRASIPADQIEVDRRVVGNLDGDECCEYWAEGVELRHADLQFIGAAHATRPGAQSAFYSEIVYAITRERLDEIKGITAQKADARQAKWAAAEAAHAAKFEQAAQTGQPVPLESWTETRTVREGHESAEYLFIVTEYAMPDGSTKEDAVNTY